MELLIGLGLFPNYRETIRGEIVDKDQYTQIKITLWKTLKANLLRGSWVETAAHPVPEGTRKVLKIVLRQVWRAWSWLWRIRNGGEKCVNFLHYVNFLFNFLIPEIWGGSSAETNWFKHRIKSKPVLDALSHPDDPRFTLIMWTRFQYQSLWPKAMKSIWIIAYQLHFHLETRGESQVLYLLRQAASFQIRSILMKWDLSELLTLALNVVI